MNKNIIIENIIKINLKLNHSIIEDAVNIFFNIFLNAELYDPKHVENIIEIILSSYKNIKSYQLFLCYCYAYAKTNDFLDNFDKLYKVIYNLKSLRLDQIQKYFVPYINKPNSYGIDKIIDHLFCSYRNHHNNKLDNKILKIIIDLSNIDLTEEIINNLDSLVYNICFNDYILDYTPLVDSFCHKYLTNTKN